MVAMRCHATSHRVSEAMRAAPPTSAPSAARTSLDEPRIVDHRNFYRVEKWSRAGLHIEEMLFP